MKTYRLNRESRYPNGYIPKIEYWEYKMNKAIKNLDVRGIEFAAGKLAYFVERENERIARLETVFS